MVVLTFRVRPFIHSFIHYALKAPALCPMLQTQRALKLEPWPPQQQLQTISEPFQRADDDE